MRRIGATAVIFMLSACGPGRAPEAKPSPAAPRQSETFGDAMIQEITPLAAGGAYAVAITGEVWYLSGGEAVRVKETPRLSPVVAPPLKGNEAFLFASLGTERRKAQVAKAKLGESTESRGPTSEQ